MKILSVNFNTYSSVRKAPVFKAENASVPTENKTGDETEIENQSKRNYIIGGSIAAALILAFVAIKKGWFSGKKAAQIVEETSQPHVKPSQQPQPQPQIEPKGPATPPDLKPENPTIETEVPNANIPPKNLVKRNQKRIKHVHEMRKPKMIERKELRQTIAEQVDNVSQEMEDIITELETPKKSLDEMIEIQKDVIARVYKKDS